MTPETPKPEAVQHKVMLGPVAEGSLHKTAEALGFLSGNGLSATILTTFAGIPPHRVFAALAHLRAMHGDTLKKGRRIR